MEPSFRVISIDKEIKFKKADLEALKDSKEYDSIKSDDYRVCSISNVQYFLQLYPNGHKDDCRGQTWVFLYIKLGNAVKVKTDVVISIDSIGFSTKIKEEYVCSKGWGEKICTTEEVFDSTKKFFIIEEIIFKIKGTVKIYLRPDKIVYPFSTKWKIKKADLESLKTTTDIDDDENRILTKDIKLGTYSDYDIECCLAFYPNDDDKESLGIARLYLYLEFKYCTYVEVIYNISIDSANYSEDFDGNFAYDGDWDTTICSTKDLFKPENQYFVDGEMTIKISGTLIMPKEEDYDSDEMECDEDTVKKDSAADDGKDFTIFVGEKSVKVHKQLLLDSSPYFIALFNSGMKESIEMKTTITDFDFEIVEAGIQILYDPSKIPSNFSFEQMLELLRFSDKYDIGVIKDLLQNHLIENLSPTNVCPLINYTTTTVSAPKLFAKCFEYVVKCSKESNAIHGLETLDKELWFKILAETFVKNF